MLRPRNLQREETFRTLKSLIIGTVKIVYMFIYEFCFRKLLATLTDYSLLLQARVKTALPRFGSRARKI